MLAVWIPGRTTDGIVEIKTDIILKNLKIKGGFIFDSLNGTRQKLKSVKRKEDTVLEGMLIKDYPVFVKLIP